MQVKMLSGMMMMMMMMMMEMVCCSNTNWITYNVVAQCPLSPFSSPPLQMDGALFEQVETSLLLKGYATVVFYDSGSPFSNDFRYTFDLLSSMFPQINHIALEQSGVMPSLFSRYGVHSLPALFIMNNTHKWRYYGPKDLHSLTQLYKKVTGYDPLYYHVVDESLENVKVMQPWYQLSWKDMMVKEPYLVFAIVFLVMRAILFVCPEIVSHVTAIWMLCKHHINLRIFGETSQLLGSALHTIDVKRVWRKVKRCKSSNFEKARAWASSLASVSLGEASATPSSSSIHS